MAAHVVNNDELGEIMNTTILENGAIALEKTLEDGRVWRKQINPGEFDLAEQNGVVDLANETFTPEIISEYQLELENLAQENN